MALRVHSPLTIIYRYNKDVPRIPFHCMGNNVSSISNPDMDETRNMALRLDLYAQRIILKEVKFNSTLGDSGKCEKLIIITSEVLNRLPFRLISYMDRRHKLFSKHYEDINAMDRALLVNTNPEILKESKLDEQNVFRKRQMCVGIARFYVQIGNLFNAIMSTMRPYNYEYIQKNMPDNFYDMLTFGLLDGPEVRNKDKSKYDTYNMAGFTRRQTDVKAKMERLLKPGEIDMKITPGSGICSIKKDIDNIKITPMSMTTTASTITQNKIKPSIFAMLEELYFDIFHEISSSNKSPQFIAMSEEMKNKIYRRDVAELYRIVTGGKEPGDDIKTFADVSHYINDNNKINEWCEGNKGLEIPVNNNVRYNPIFVKYIKHIQSMNFRISKQRKGIVKLLDRVFTIMNKREDVLLEIEESLDKGDTKRYSGFEQDDQYSRDFFRLNLKYDFFINPNLTDADLQAITNEARTRIVRLYADSYKNFLTGFEILQELQANLGLDALVQAKELAKKETENPTAGNNAAAATAAADKSKEFDQNNIDSFPEEKELSDKIQNAISGKNIDLANLFRIKKDEIVEAVYKNSGNVKLTAMLWDKLKLLNTMAKTEIIYGPERLNTNVKERISSRLNTISIKDTVNTMNPAVMAVV